MANKKGTKLIWRGYETDWGKLPMVIIQTELLKQKWFEGDIYFVNQKMGSEEAREKFEKNKIKPFRLYITSRYKTFMRIIKVFWNGEFKDTTNIGRCEVLLVDPRIKKYFPIRRSRSKPRGSLYLEGVLERIKIALEEAKPAVDEEIEREAKKEQKKIEAEKFKENLCKELKVTLDSGYISPYSYIYGKDRSYGMNFKKNDDGTFQLETVRGDFTTKEIKEFIKIVGGNPRAVADRLTNKKRIY